MKKHKGMISEHLMSVMNDNISKVQPDLLEEIHAYKIPVTVRCVGRDGVSRDASTTVSVVVKK
ncbi:MAG: hypothetical protein HDR06_09015 [Lachnospiraceae bacterium]|nr:hypothetical protein [Lachnospiraceae bacterium]